LLITILLYIYSGHRARHESRQMRWSDIIPNEDETGRYLEFRERATKTRTGETANARPFAPRAYANEKDPQRCPVELYHIYASHRPMSTLQDDAPFYLAINNMLKDFTNARKWYKISSLGENSISGLMRGMAQEAGLKGKYVNHSIRKTGICNLLHAGVSPTLIQQISGHKDVKSISNYASASREQVREMNQILSNPKSVKPRATATVSIPDDMPALPNDCISDIAQSSLVPKNPESVSVNIGSEHFDKISEPIPEATASHAMTMMSASTSTMSDLFQHANLSNCTFNITFQNGTQK